MRPDTYLALWMDSFGQELAEHGQYNRFPRRVFTLVVLLYTLVLLLTHLNGPLPPQISEYAFDALGEKVS